MQAQETASLRPPGQIRQIHPELIAAYDGQLLRGCLEATERYSGAAPEQLAKAWQELNPWRGELSTGERGWIAGARSAVEALIRAQEEAAHG